MRYLLTLFFLALAVITQAGTPTQINLSTIDADAMSGDPARIKQAISAYEGLHVESADVAWRLVRAYFNYYDELTDRDRRDEQQWAADHGYEIAKRALEKYPHQAEVVYYFATIGLCYLDFHRLKAVFLVNDLLTDFEKARRLDPNIDDAGPDRSLGILYHELPGWPLGKGDKKKSLEHLQAAVRIAPERAANRITLAKVLAEHGDYDEGWKHIVFIRAGKFKVSSQHWHDIYMKRVEEVAKDFPQNGK